MKNYKDRTRAEKGQAMLEFIVMIPVVIAFLWFIIKVNLAINTSIVGQKHARSHLFLKMHNHRDGPIKGEYLGNPQQRSAYILLVGQETALGAGVFVPAPVVDLGIGIKPKQFPGATDDRGEPDTRKLRQRVRIRTSFGICTSRKPGTNGALGEFCGNVPF